MPEVLRTALSLAVSLGVAWYVAGQVKRPDRFLGRVIAKVMNSRHSGLTDWGLSRVHDVHALQNILDVGCGGGRTLAKLARLAPNAKLVGVDIASGSIAETRQQNAALIEAGRLEVIQASVAELPVPSAQFDLVTAIETHYYWTDLQRCVSEVRRVMRPGGQFLLVAESYAGGRFSRVARGALAPLGARILTPEEHRAVLDQAGFVDVGVHEDRKRGWICTVARTPK